jgi:hypothetical protein
MKGLKKNFQSFSKIVLLVPINMFWLGCTIFGTSMILKIYFILMILIIALKKSFKKVTILIFHEIFIQEDTFEMCFGI